MPDTTRYRFDPFLLEPALRRLRRDAVEITIPPKAFDILVLLVRARDRVLAKQELLDAVWPETAVTENTLTQRIREIREALGDEAQEPRYIRTISRVGYRFVGDVTEESAPPPRRPAIVQDEAQVIAAEPAGNPTREMTPSMTAQVDDGAASTAARAKWTVYAGAVAIVVLGGLLVWFSALRQPPPVRSERRIESLVVLPLENLSHDAAQDYFADGMTDELSTELAAIRSLRVISRTSALRYKGSTKTLREIGHELNVDAIVEGSVLRAGEQARITLKLVDVATDRTLLARSFARDLQDILALQSEIARAVAEQIRATVAPAAAGTGARRVNPGAYDDYLRGRSAWWKRTPGGLEDALQLFQRAIEKDPTYAAAWAGVADCYIVFGGALLGLPEAEAYPKAREAATQALALDETLAEAHTSLGSVKNEYDWDRAGAEAEYTRAIAINGSYVTARQWYGEFLYFQGRHDEALAQLKLAQQLDPLSPVVNNSLARASMFAGRLDEAIAQGRRALEVDPGFGGAYLTLGEAYMQQGRHADAIAALQQAARLWPHLSRPVAWLGHAYGVAGARDKARQTLAQLEAFAGGGPVSPYDVALVHASLGDTQQTFAWLEKAYDARAGDLIQLNVDPRFDGLRRDARLLDLTRRLGLSAAAVK